MLRITNQNLHPPHPCRLAQNPVRRALKFSGFVGVQLHGSFFVLKSMTSCRPGLSDVSETRLRPSPISNPPAGQALGPHKLQPAPVLTQRPRTRPGKPTPQRCAHSNRNQTQKSHTLPPHAACENQHAFPFVFRRLKLCTAEAPPAAATFLQPRADLKAAPGKERKAESQLQETPLQTPALLPPSPPVFNVANGNPRKAS